MSKVFLQSLGDALKISKEAPVLITSEGGKTSIGTFSSYHSVVFTMETDLADFSAVVPNELARQLQRTLNESRLKFETEGNTLTARAKGVKLTVPLSTEKITLESLLTKYSDKKTHELNGELFNQAVVRVKPSANDKSIGDVVLRGYHMTTDDGIIEVMATNGAVLTTVAVPCDSKLKDSTVLLNPEFHLISQFLEEDSAFAQEEATLSLYSKGKERETFAVTNFTKGNPVPYSKVIEAAQKNEVTFKVNNKEFLDALKGVAYFADETKKNRIELTALPEGLVISSNNSQGNSVVELSIDEVEGIPEAGISMATSHDNLIGYFGATKSLLTEIRIKDSKSPIYLTDGFIHQVSVLHFN